MLRWMGPRAKELTGKRSSVTDDPLAAIDPDRKDQGIYSVSRVNPLFIDTYRDATIQRPPRKQKAPPSRSSRQSTPSGEKSSSSGYGGSNSYSNEPIFSDSVKLKEDAVSIIEQNTQYVKSIKVATRTKNNKSTHSSGSSGTLSTIPEGRVDFSIPRPIWPNKHQRTCPDYDSLVDEAVLLYTSLSYKPESVKTPDGDVSIREVLVELLHNINATMEGKGVLSPEEMLKRVNEKIALSLEALKNATEEEMRMLCVNLSNSKKVNSVVRAFSNSSSSGHSSQSSPEWSSRARTVSSEAEEIYEVPSGSSSSGFSDAKPFENPPLPVFVHEDLSSVPNGVRNAMIYGTLCRTSFKSGGAQKVGGDVAAEQVKKTLIRAEDNKPSVWEQYYGVNVAEEVKLGATGYVPKPTDVPVFPGGRPEADFTLDVPRSELLSKRMKQDKKWRCRCRLLTTLLGLVFFLLSVMAVSLMLTRGQRMFGSML